MNGGVQEDGTAFAAKRAFDGLARFRTFGDGGPLYEVLSVDVQTVRVHVFDNDEEFDYRLDRALADPIAH
jgi:hypothetical protein